MKETIATQEATIKTSKGDITLTLYPDVAPKTVANFIKKAESGFYDDLTFHRVEDWVVQGGDPKGNGTGGGDMATELNNKPFIVGSLGVARGQDIKISNDAQFFITKKEASWLNGQYTNFGIVKKGIDVVDTIEISDKILGITVK
ncbi:MAG: peptidylprolyl isomerase [Candidatus Levybacteria bacterium]|nr:peptidylprolyl isomerase [Candidatus Levybacteria bacterium]